MVNMTGIIEVKNCIERGNENFKQGNLDQALRYFDKAVELDPTNPHAYSVRGVTEFRMGFYESGWEDLNKAIQIAPEDRKVRYHMGLAMRLGQNYEAATGDFSNVLRDPATIKDIKDCKTRSTPPGFDQLDPVFEAMSDFPFDVDKVPHVPDLAIDTDIVLYTYYNAGDAQLRLGNSGAALAYFHAVGKYSGRL